MPSLVPTRPTYDDFPATNTYRQHVTYAFGIAFTEKPTETWLPWRGHEVHMDDWRPRGAPRATVILVHGAGGYGRLLAPFAAPLREAGFAVRVPDLPGYGLTRMRPGARAEYDEWVALVAGLADEAAQHGPVFLFGLSVGGMTCLWAAQRARKVSGVAATTLIDLRDPRTFVRATRAPWMGYLSLAAFRFLPSLTDAVSFPLSLIVPVERLTPDVQLARALLSDPLLGKRWAQARCFRTITTYTPERDDFELPCPLLLVHPGADTWTPVEMSLPVYEQVPTAKELVVLSNGGHAPLESPAYGELCSTVTRFLEARV
ncbi:alpha/beta hydrolase [Pendulispora rubella]|uniref:Alpha/beta hydrolase n=1 Tax=Pendulispora rubella TaxID=2741070 RepID=A0ABZ2LIB3_9BACT